MRRDAESLIHLVLGTEEKKVVRKQPVTKDAAGSPINDKFHHNDGAGCRGSSQ